VDWATWHVIRSIVTGEPSRIRCWGDDDDVGVGRDHRREGPDVKYNIGGGDLEIPGYVNVDRKHGLEAYPLACPDVSLDEIRASHVLEHFSYRVVPAVVADWVNKLKPGGLLKVAVPDFRWLAVHYLLGTDIPLQGFVMGGHVDEDDYHRALFDEPSLRHHMRIVGLTDIVRWKSEVDDCAAMDVSLNLQGRKV